jgi:predicted ester cyclase
MADEPIDVVRKLYDAWKKLDYDAGREVIHPDAVHHAPASGSNAEHPVGTPYGREEWLKVWAVTQHFFPDMTNEIDDYVQTGDMVAVRCTVTGTHTVDFFGIEPNGNRYAMPMMAFSRVRDGKIVEHWAISDHLQLVGQIGGELPEWVLGRRSASSEASSQAT